MKTKAADRENRKDAPASVNSEPTYYVLGSSLNMPEEIDLSNTYNHETGYPDFYEDTDNMNRYLW